MDASRRPVVDTPSWSARLGPNAMAQEPTSASLAQCRRCTWRREMLEIVLAAGLVCCAVAGAAYSAPLDEAAIRSNVAAFEDAWNKRDATGVVATYAPDGDVVISDGPRVAGRAAIRRLLEAEFATTPSTMRLTLTVTSIRTLTLETAIAETVARFSEGAVRENRGTSVFVRQDGKWLVSALRVLPAQRP